MHGGGPRPQQHAGGNGNFGGGGPNGNPPHGEHGGGHHEPHAGAPTGTPPAHDPDSSGNV
jgi:hypothetical protein